jgi:hypothetical protein
MSGPAKPRPSLFLISVPITRALGCEVIVLDPTNPTVGSMIDHENESGSLKSR